MTDNDKKPVVKLDEGVRYFVDALQFLGCTTIASCDGHGDPAHFYILFEAPSYDLALAIAQAGYFSVKLWRREMHFRIGMGPRCRIEKVGINPHTGENVYQSYIIEDEKEKADDMMKTLELARESWEEKLLKRVEKHLWTRKPNRIRES